MKIPVVTNSKDRRKRKQPENLRNNILQSILKVSIYHLDELRLFYFCVIYPYSKLITMQQTGASSQPLIPKLYQYTRSEKIAVTILIILYLVGTIGFIFKIHPEFSKLTPVNLFLSLIIVLIFHQQWHWKMVLFCLICPIVGFLVEMKGVETGLIFGSYQYGETLGFKLNNTPLSIGVNWLLLTYSSAILVNHAAKEESHIVLKAILASALMVSLDVLIEPIAMKTDMWSWANNKVPMQNYLGWFLTALPLHLLFFILNKSVKNKVAVSLLILQFLFFWILSFFIS
jgi:bisanhydrobacterioruberin hydratase